MSYLGLPRLVFSGRFQTDPSTVNNDPEHFNTDRFRSNYQEVSTASQMNGWWNPGGTAAFRFFQCKVVRAVYRDGTDCVDPSADPIVGAAVRNAGARVEGKIVDLDPEQQGCSQLWGLAVRVGGESLGFGGDFEVSAFADLWFSRVTGSNGGDSYAAAFWQSVLAPLEWKGDGTSRLLGELLSADGAPPQKLSIRFTVDGYDDNRRSPTFTLGRIAGAIGLYLPGEPKTFVPGRRLWAVPAAQTGLPQLQDAYACIDKSDVLHIDLSNSLVDSSPGGPSAPMGKLQVSLQPQSPAGAPPIPLVDVPYQDPTWYASSAGIVSVRLSADLAQKAASTPLVLTASSPPSSTSPGGTTAVLAEAGNGQWVRADDIVFRLNPRESLASDAHPEATTTLYATCFGAPLAGATITLGYDPTNMLGQATQGPAPGPQRLGTPEKALSFPTTLTTDSAGTAPIGLAASDPGNPRGYIDGQLYGVTYAIGDSPPPYGSVSNAALQLNVLVWSRYQAPDVVDWLNDVRPIFQQYANLYPVMRPIVDLANYASIVSRLEIMKSVFRAKLTDPNYMPVTRDLSLAKHNMLRHWLERPHYMRLESVADLHTALQQAIELEHATIPTYLTALYSIKPGCNVEIATLLRDVVIEEMLHMALACNLLVSIGGRPRIGHPGFVPNYPGPLPGGLRAGLVVRLRRLSIAQVRDIFMSIEQPHKVIEPVHGQADKGDPVDVTRYTIGWFYDEIERSLTRLAERDQITFGHADEQVTGWRAGPGRLFAIQSLHDARRAIHEIKRQGEGTSSLDPDDGDRELAHYYKFAEIVHGRRLVRHGREYSYTGDVVPFDEDGVFPMADDPNVGRLPAGSRAAILQQQFAETYQALLHGLHRTWNGEPRHIDQSVGLMYSLDLAARALMVTPLDDKSPLTAGPSFQLPMPL